MLKKEICGTYIWEIWDLDESFKELHFSGFAKELCEATEKKITVSVRPLPLRSLLFFVVFRFLFTCFSL